MSFKHLILAVIGQAHESAHADPLLQQLMSLLSKLKDAPTDEVDATLSGKLDTLLREVRHSGFETARAKMLIKEILSMKTPVYPDWKKAMDPRGMKVGEAISILASGVNVGKSMLGRVLGKEAPSIKASELGEVIIDSEERTLTYFDKDGSPIFVVEDFIPGCIKVKNRSQK